MTELVYSVMGPRLTSPSPFAVPAGHGEGPSMLLVPDGQTRRVGSTEPIFVWCSATRSTFSYVKTVT